jgi:hypothetical protein
VLGPERKGANWSKGGAGAYPIHVPIEGARAVGRRRLFLSLGPGNDKRDKPFQLNTTQAQTMKTLSALSLLVAIASVGLAAPAFAGEEVATSATTVKEDAATDCSKQVWPHFSATCLRNDQARVVRIVTADRR